MAREDRQFDERQERERLADTNVSYKLEKEKEEEAPRSFAFQSFSRRQEKTNQVYVHRESTTIRPSLQKIRFTKEERANRAGERKKRLDRKESEEERQQREGLTTKMKARREQIPV